MWMPKQKHHFGVIDHDFQVTVVVRWRDYAISNEQSKSPIRAHAKTMSQLWHNRYAFSTRCCSLLSEQLSNITYAITTI